MVKIIEVSEGVFEVRLFSSKYAYETNESYQSWQFTNWNTYFTDAIALQGTPNYGGDIKYIADALIKYSKCILKDGNNRLFKVGEGRFINVYQSDRYCLINFFKSIDEWRRYNS